MSKSKIFILLCAGFATGVFLASLFKISEFWVLIGLGVTVIVFYFGYMLKILAIFLLAVFFFSVGLGVLRLNSSFTANQFSESFGEKQKIEGLIVEDIDLRPDRQLLTFQPFGQSQKILITTTKAVEYFYGDRVVVEGKVAEAKNFEDFDYQKYLERYEIYAVIKYPKILVLKTNQASVVKYQLLRLKAWLVTAMSQKFEEPGRSLVLGVLIGAKKALPEQVVQNFRVTGLSHIVAVSGYNISILVIFLGSLAYVFGRKIGFYFTLLAIIGFAGIAGMSASVIRAALMGGLLLWAYKLGRPYTAGPAICFAATIMVLINPRILFWDVGFQLSFLATMGIVFGLPVLEEFFQNIPKAWEIKSILLSSFTAIVMTLPLSLAQFGQLPVYALLANMLVLPLVPPLMLFGFLSLVPFLGPGFAFLAKIIVGYVLWVVKILSSLPYAVIMVDFNAIGIVVSYFLILTVFFGLKIWLHSSKPVDIEKT